MIAATTFAGQRVALFGLGGSGLATARALKAGGADVAVWDDNLSAREKVVADGFAPVDLASADWSQFSSFILSPGVPLTHPEPHWTVKKARAAGVEIIGDVEIFCRERRKVAPRTMFVAITGTNGKSTTTALTAHILREAGRDTQMGGNIGTPILSLAPLSDDRVYVIELSTFQIDLTPSLDPSIGMLLNLTPDHIDRHGTMENYAAIKERLVAASEIALVSVDDDFCNAIGARLRARETVDDGSGVFPVSVRRQLNWGYFVDGSTLLARGADQPVEESETLGNLAGIATLRGAHNAQNAIFAAAACWHCGLDEDQIARGLRSFPGLAHRMENLGKLGRVLFVNDSKATNADAAEKALLSFNDMFWIIGGKSKEGGIEPLRPLFSRVAKAYLIGAATEDFVRTLDGALPYEKCGTLDVATRAAARDAAQWQAPEPVVLLSPACASYDQFPNFEKRGDAFRSVVADIIKAEGAS